MKKSVKKASERALLFSGRIWHNMESKSSNKRSKRTEGIGWNFVSDDKSNKLSNTGEKEIGRNSISVLCLWMSDGINIFAIWQGTLNNGTLTINIVPMVGTARNRAWVQAAIIHICINHSAAGRLSTRRLQDVLHLPFLQTDNGQTHFIRGARFLPLQISAYRNGRLTDSQKGRPNLSNPWDWYFWLRGFNGITARLNPQTPSSRKE